MPAAVAFPPDQQRFKFDAVVGESAASARLFATLERVAPMAVTVLIQGETGTGKELVARAIHQNSPRRSGPFVAFNAAAIPDTLAESELFGHVKGAFTDASQNRVGRFEHAEGGTLFIDEVTSMSMALQAKLLRVLQERQIERVGDSRTINVNIRLIGASNVDLLAEVRAGRFREDLFYRLNVVRVNLAPLRERTADIPALARHFATKHARLNGLPVLSLSTTALDALQAYDWPGNIRQLENAIEHAVVLSGRSLDIGVDALPEEIRQPFGMEVRQPLVIPENGIDFASAVAQLERQLILGCLEKTRGNKRQAAMLLRLSRTTLIDKLHRLQPPVPAFTAARGIA